MQGAPRVHIPVCSIEPFCPVFGHAPHAGMHIVGNGCGRTAAVWPTYMAAVWSNTMRPDFSRPSNGLALPCPRMRKYGTPLERRGEQTSAVIEAIFLVYMPAEVSLPKRLLGCLPAGPYGRYPHKISPKYFISTFGVRKIEDADL